MPRHRSMIDRDLHAPSNEEVENNSAASIVKMRAVRFDGFGTAFMQIELGNGLSNVIRGITQADVDNTVSINTGFITALGILTDLDTSAFLVNDFLYAGASGVLQTTPNGAIIAQVLVSDTINGRIYVQIPPSGTMMDDLVKVSASDTTRGFLDSELTVDTGSNTTNALEKGITNPTADEKLNIRFDETKVNHDNILNVGTNTHTQIDTHIADTSNPHDVTFTQAVAADAGTDITAAEAETLTDGSNADALHTHAASTDEKVSISGTDTTPGFLNDELTIDTGSNSTNALEKSITSPAANEKLNIRLDETKIDHDALSNFVSGEHTDAQVKVSSNDTTPGYLEDKIIASNGTNTTNPLEQITLNDGSDEDVQIRFDETKVNHDNILNVGTNTHTQIDTHLASTSNPHSVTFTQAVIADGGTDITTAEAETLTDGSNADALHTHVASTDDKVSISANDTTPGFLLDKLIVADEANITNILELKEINDAANEDLKIAFDESKIDHGSISGLGDDDHTQYVLRSILTTKGDIFVRTATGIVRLPVGTDGQRLESDSVNINGVKWVTPTPAMSVGPLSFSFSSQEHVILKGKKDVYTTAAYLSYPGSNVAGTPTTIKMEASTKDTGITADIKIFDRTNAVTIIEKTLYSSAVDDVIETIDLGTLTGAIPTGYAAWELQIKLSAKGAGKEFSAGSLTIF